MADLTFMEKARLEELLGMKSGYVLDLSNRQFRELVQDSVQKNIDDPVYEGNGTSKGNRLRSFWRMESNGVVGKVLYDLIQYLGNPEEPGPRKLYQECADIVKRLLQKAEAPKRNVPPAPATPSQDEASVRFVCLKCGRLSDRAFPIGESGQALCPTCASDDATLPKILNEGLVVLLESGATFRNYKLQSAIGAGAWGEVWKALQSDLGRFVALKFPVTPDKETLARFRREAQVGARLSHPNIPHIYALDNDNGQHFIAMEFIDGQSFDELLWPDSMVALQAVRDIARALGHVHKVGVVHRDIKPGNLLMSKSGRPYLTDFGLATLPEASTALTATGVFVGTPEFASPEQKMCLRVDARADIYSLGATLYNLLTGSIYGGSKPASKQIPQEIQLTLNKCLAEKPGNRYQSSDEFAGALDAIVSPGRFPSQSSLNPKDMGSVPSKAVVTAEWKEAGSGLPAGYDLRLKCDAVLASGGSALSFELPPVVGLMKVREPGGWHSDPSLDRPRVWIDPPTGKTGLAHLGRVCWYKSPVRLASNLGLIRWTLLGGELDGTSDTLEMDVDRFLPLASRPALSPSRALSFESCKSIEDVNFHADGRKFSPTLERDDRGAQVLRSAAPEGDAPIYLYFDPNVSLNDISAVSLRLRVGRSKYFMIHYWVKHKDGPDLIITCKHGEIDERKHSENEWVLPLEIPPSSDTWETFRRDLRSDVARMFPSQDLSAISLSQIALRGNYWLDRMDFPPA
jgi:predicted Ser/Thr protein kinase